MPTSIKGVPRFDQIKIVKVGNIVGTMPPASGFKLTQVSHGLGYAPGFMAYAVISGFTGRFLLPFIQLNLATGSVQEHSLIEVDDTLISLKMYAPNTAGNALYTNGFTREIRYYLWVEIAT